MLHESGFRAKPTHLQPGHQFSSPSRSAAHASFPASGKRSAWSWVLLTVEQHRAEDNPGGIVVYWRPMCAFCGSLRRQLDKHRIEYHLVNIWDNPAGAAYVRSVARGHETVPTVSVGTVALVNPTVQAVLAAARKHTRASVPTNYEAPQPRGLFRLIARVLGG
ncbi:MAG: glutaredoxin domain-containing protein [Acidimicrobiales bacterium]